MKTSISSKKIAVLSLLVLFLAGIVSASYYYSETDSYSVGDDTGFSIPEYESQSELATQLVAPFIFIVVLLKFSFERVLQFVLDSNNHPPWEDEKPDVSREATVMAVAVAGMMIPTPFWDYVRLVASGIGLVTAITVLLMVLFLMYAFLKV